jgi:hypothetical protein
MEGGQGGDEVTAIELLDGRTIICKSLYPMDGLRSPSLCPTRGYLKGVAPLVVVVTTQHAGPGFSRTIPG